MNKPRVKAEALEMFLSFGPLLNGLIVATVVQHVASPIGDGFAFTLATLASCTSTVGSYLGLRDVYAPTKTRLLAEADQVAASQRSAA